MADIVHKQGQGQTVRRELDGAALIVVLLQAAEADGTLRDYDTLSALLGAAGNTEATFTNYARKTVTAGDFTATYDATNKRWDADFPDQTWASAGGATNNTLVKLLVCIDGADDTARAPITSHEFAVTTDGSDLTAQVATAGFYRAA